MNSLGTTLDELKDLLRESLRVGTDLELRDDFPLMRGPIELDSIDILHMISTIERRFVMKIPSEALSPSAFETVATLAAYIDRNRVALADKSRETAGGEAARSSRKDARSEAYLARLPHGPDFRFVSEVRDLVEGEEARGAWMVRGNEAFLAGHFPGRPLVPGVLIAEALAQMAGLAAGRVSETAVLLNVEINFLGPVVPPATIELRAKAVKDSQGGGATSSLRRCETVASVNGVPVAKGFIALKFKTAGDGRK